MAKLIPGIEFDFGAEVLLVPPLALGDLELMRDRLGSMELGSLDAQSVGTIIDAVLAALQRNYPEMTRERVAKLLDLGNMADAIQCVMDVSGVRRKEIEAGKALAAQGPVLEQPQS